MRQWHAVTTAQVAQALSVDPENGLAPAEAAARLRAHGANRCTPQPGGQAWAHVAAQWGAPLVLMLLTTGALAACLGEWLAAAAIFAVVLINALAGFIQATRADAVLAAQTHQAFGISTVVRGGARLRLDAADLVVGDVVVLGRGDLVPADLRLLSAVSLRIAQTSLTGQAAPVAKQCAPLAQATELDARSNMAYAHTLVVAGQGRGIVIATADQTEAGRAGSQIAQRAQTVSALPGRLVALSRWVLLSIGLLAALTFVVGVARGVPTAQMLMAMVTLVVGAIPEGLPVAVAITLAIAVARLGARRVSIRRLAAVHALGSTTVVCADKTGTLTENTPTVREIWLGAERYSVSGQGYSPHGQIEQGGHGVPISAALQTCLRAAALCNDARLVQTDGEWLAEGDPTEAALLVAARKAGLDDATLHSQCPRIDELPFDAACQYMATLHAVGPGQIAYVKGAVERILPACVVALDRAGQPVAYDLAEAQRVALRMASSGLRVLAVASVRLGEGHILTPGHCEAGLTFLGIVGMVDPPRLRAIGAVRACQLAGIRVKMMTGDHPATALAMARHLGIAAAGSTPLSGSELALLDDAAFARAAREVDVFARMAGGQKLRLVQALQAQGEVVAITGDGVDDAAALQHADVGVAMGARGSAAVRDAADIILDDDSFSTLAAAIEEGRGVYDNLAKFMAWALPTSAAEGLLVMAAMLAGVALPITPLQLLWINMTTVLLLGTGLAFEPVERDIMVRPPRGLRAPILDRTVLGRATLICVLLVGGAFGLFALSLFTDHSLAQAQTIAANVFVAVQGLYLLSCRSFSAPCWAPGALANPWLWGGCFAMAALQMLFTYAPALNRVFHTAPLAAHEWLLIGAFAALCSLLIEWDKALRRASDAPPNPPAAP